VSSQTLHGQTPGVGVALIVMNDHVCGAVMALPSRSVACTDAAYHEPKVSDDAGVKVAVWDAAS
jgi:hypothetical protein